MKFSVQQKVSITIVNEKLFASIKTMNSNINATKTHINVNKFKEITVLGTFCLCDLMDVYKNNNN